MKVNMRHFPLPIRTIRRTFSGFTLILLVRPWQGSWMKKKNKTKHKSRAPSMTMAPGAPLCPPSPNLPFSNSLKFLV